MKQIIRQCVILLALFGVLLLTGCGTSSNNGVYSDYGYPRNGYGYGCCYDDNDYYDNRRERAQERRERVQERRESTNYTRPSPTGGGMGRPARVSRGGGGRGGGRGR